MVPLLSTTHLAAITDHPSSVGTFYGVKPPSYMLPRFIISIQRNLEDRPDSSEASALSDAAGGRKNHFMADLQIPIRCPAGLSSSKINCAYIEDRNGPVNRRDSRVESQVDE